MRWTAQLNDSLEIIANSVFAGVVTSVEFHFVCSDESGIVFAVELNVYGNTGGIDRLDGSLNGHTFTVGLGSVTTAESFFHSADFDLFFSGLDFFNGFCSNSCFGFDLFNGVEVYRVDVLFHYVDNLHNQLFRS